MTLKSKRRLVKSNAGSVLVMSVVISLAIILVGTAYLKFVDHYRVRLSYDIYDCLADGAAFAGLAVGLAENSSGGSYFESDIEELFANKGITVNYNYILDPEGDCDFGFSNTVFYSITGQGFVSGPEFEDELKSAMGHSTSSRSYADWLYITDRETQEYRPSEPNGDDTLRFWGPDTLDGRVHSNDKLHFQQGLGHWPVFYEEVTSCSTEFSPDDADQYVHFYGGYKLGVSRLDFPTQADSVRKYGYYYEGQPLGGDGLGVTELTLEPEGFYVRHRPNSTGSRNLDHFDFGEDITFMHIKPYPATQALFIEGELWITAAKDSLHYNNFFGNDSLVLRGFRGELTIGASGDIIIAQNVMYESSLPNGDVPIGSPDVLGLISEKHILIWRGVDDNSTIIVNAALAAIGLLPDEDLIEASRCPPPYDWRIPVDGIHGTISVDGINCYDQSMEKYQLKIYGCLIMRERGLIHTHYQGGLRGFRSKQYKYDFRFRYHPPPHFFKTKGRAEYYSLKLDNIFGLY